MKHLVATLLPLALVGCSTSEPRQQIQTEHSYLVEWIGERPLIDRSHLSVSFGEDGRAFGSGGCNHWFAGYTLEGGKLQFSQPGSTRKACSPALMEQEQRFFDALGKVERWDFSEIDQLRLWPAEGEPIRLWSEQYPGQ